jgi:2-dehydropantoate 2-reductase
MRVAVMGTGGVGAYFGAKLAKAGNEVAFIARGANLAAMRQRGLRVETEAGPLVVERPIVTDNPGEIGPVDIVLFTVKLWDTESAAESIRPLIGPDTGVISLQNGVEKDAVLRRVLGAGHVMGGVCYIAATIAEPGVIRVTGKMQRIVAGEFGLQGSRRAEAFVAAARDAGIDAGLGVDIERAIWEKFVFLVGMSGSTTLVRRPIGVVRAVAESRALLLDAMKEVVTLARGRGVAVPDDFAENRLAFVDQLPEATTSSMHNDIERGSRLEVDWLSGAVARLGGEAGLAMPVNRVIHAALKPHAAGRTGMGAPR